MSDCFIYKDAEFQLMDFGPQRYRNKAMLTGIRHYEDGIYCLVADNFDDRLRVHRIYRLWINSLVETTKSSQYIIYPKIQDLYHR